MITRKLAPTMPAETACVIGCIGSTRKNPRVLELPPTYLDSRVKSVLKKSNNHAVLSLRSIK